MTALEASNRTPAAVASVAAAQARCRDAAGLDAFVALPAPAPGGSFAYALKDMVDVAGHAPSLGLAAAPFSPARTSAPLVAQLEAAGGRCVAFTTMSPLACEPLAGAAAKPVGCRPHLRRLLVRLRRRGCRRGGAAGARF